MFDEDDDQALTELARQVGLALHNVKLDSALQDSLEEVQRQADELRASRSRIVQAGDEQRRAIERNLHDGAQQHLVALAVSVRFARQLAESDPAQSLPMLDQIGTDLQDAVQELRSLAHGIYPPLLAERGLPDALSAAAGRAALATSVQAEGVGRYDQRSRPRSTSVCSKRSRTQGSTRVKVPKQRSRCVTTKARWSSRWPMTARASTWERVRTKGHGFVNMADRVGAIGGTLAVDSAPGKGTQDLGQDPADRVTCSERCSTAALSAGRASPRSPGRRSGPRSSLLTYAAAPLEPASAGMSSALYVETSITTTFGMRTSDLARGLDAVDPGHVDVHEDEVGCEAVDHLDGLLAGLGVAGDLEARCRPDDGSRGASKRRLIVDDEDCDVTALALEVPRHSPILPPGESAEHGC